MKVRALLTTAFAIALMAVIFSVARAADVTREFGTPDHGVAWQKDFEGEVVYIDHAIMKVAAEGSGDVMNFSLYDETEYTPSWEGVHVGSKVKVRSDDRHRVRWVEVVPYHVWLAEQAK